MSEGPEKIEFQKTKRRPSVPDPYEEDPRLPDAVRMRGNGCDVLFVPADQGEDVLLWREDGTRTEVALPSKIPYRDMADISWDGSLLAVASRTRARVIRLSDGRASLAMEGPWMTGVACLAEHRMALLTSGGTVQLDLSDPDVRELSSVKELGLQSGSVTVGCIPMIHILDMRGSTKLEYSVNCSASCMTSLMEGRVLVLRRPPPDTGKWGTAILGSSGGKLALLAKHPLDIGRVFEEDGCILGDGGYMVTGVLEALDEMVPERLRSVSDGLEQDPPTPPPPRLLYSNNRRMELRLSGREPPGSPLPAGCREELGLGEEDWIPDSSESGLFPVLRKSPTGFSVSMGRIADDRVAETRPDTDLQADTMSYDFSGDGKLMLVCTRGGNYMVETEGGSAHRVSVQYRHCVGSGIIDPDSHMVLCRIDGENSQLDVWKRKGEKWIPVTSLPTHHMDALFLLPMQRLVFLSQRNMPREKSLTLVMRLSDDLQLLPLDTILVKTKGVWIQDGVILLQSEDGAMYELSLMDEDTEPPAVALEYAPPRGESPPCILVHRSGNDRCRYGYIGADGNWAIAPAFSGASGFLGDTAAVSLPTHGFKGLVNRTGRFVLPAHASWIGPPSEGYRRVAYASYASSDEPSDSLYGMLDPSGGFLLEPEFPLLGDMIDERAAVRFMDGDDNWITSDGTRLTEESFQECGAFSEGLAWALQNGRYGYLDTRGNHVTGVRFSNVLPFSCGVAGVILQGGQWRGIDRDGRVVISKGYDEFHPHSQGLACVRRGMGWGYVDVHGAEPFGLEFQKAYSFSEGLGVVVQGGRWNFLTLEGGLLSGSGWDGTFLPSEGMGAYRTEGLFGFVNSDGDMVTGPEFTSVRSFAEGLCAVERNGRWGFLDSSGAMAVKPLFARVLDFSGGLAPAMSGENGKWGYIDKRGTWVIAPVFSQAYNFSHGLAVAAMEEIP